MTLWDIIMGWAGARIRRSWHGWNTRMTAWPKSHWSKPQRYNPFQRWAMRRLAVVLLLLFLFRINPFHPVPIMLTLLGGSLYWVEHRVHERQVRMQYSTTPVWPQPRRRRRR